MSSDQINTKLFNRGIIQYINNLILLLKEIIYIKKIWKELEKYENKKIVDKLIDLFFSKTPWKFIPFSTFL